MIVMTSFLVIFNWIFFYSSLTPEQRDLPDALLMFSVKDYDYFGMANQYVGECFIKFSEIADITGDSGQIRQLHLTLSRPKNCGTMSFFYCNLILVKFFFSSTDLDSIRALEFRQGDKQARDFLKKLKIRLSDTTPK